jgi:hypothetical protein
MTTTTKPEGKQRGRPPVPKEQHRRKVYTLLSPGLLQRLQAAAQEAGHSLSREIEKRCDAYDGLSVLAGPHEDFVLQASSSGKAVGVLTLCLTAADKYRASLPGALHMDLRIKPKDGRRISPPDPSEPKMGDKP